MRRSPRIVATLKATLPYLSFHITGEAVDLRGADQNVVEGNVYYRE